MGEMKDLGSPADQVRRLRQPLLGAKGQAKVHAKPQKGYTALTWWSEVGNQASGSTSGPDFACGK
jgi:hypothetical protein